jgi:Integrase core domain
VNPRRPHPDRARHPCGQLAQRRDRDETPLAERLIQTLLNEGAYTRIYGTSQERRAALPLYLDRYNYRRPHAASATNHQARD